MTSPFPGMDPYLENAAYWGDFHSTFLNAWREAIADRLPDHYEARLDEKVRLVERPGLSKLVYPDIGVTRGPLSPRAPTFASSGGVITLAPLTAPIPEPVFEEMKELEIRILRRPERTIVAILELLSPSNKNEDYGDYCIKRQAILKQPIHLVELDLLVGGERPPLGIDWPAGDYTYVVAHADRRPTCDVYSWDIRDRLPVMPVPLKAPDADIAVDLAAAFAVAFGRGRYAKSINYDEPPAVKLAAEKLTWAGEVGKK